VRKNYDVTGPVGTLTQRTANLAALTSLGSNFDPEFYKMEFSVEGLVRAKTRFRGDGEVYDAERFEYDPTGRITRIVVADSAGQLISSTDFEHAANGKRGVTRNPEGVVIRTFADEFEAGRPTLLSSFEADGTSRTRKEFEYRDGRLFRTVASYYAPNDVRFHRWISIFDDRERVQESHGEHVDGSPLGDGKYTYEYRDDGRLWKRSYLNEFTDEVSSVETYSYFDDTRGNWVEKRGILSWRNKDRPQSSLRTRELSYYG
jgi:hypothetical protein